MKYSLVNLLLKENILLKEYSEKLVKQLIAKFKKEDRGAEEDQIRWRINRFDQVKNGIASRLKRGALQIPERFIKPDKKTGKVQNYLDINNWTYKELEGLVDAFAKDEIEPVKKGEENKIEVETDANLIYNQNGILIYQANDKGSCVKYSYMRGAYGFCIGRKEDASNQYYDYRFGRGGEYRSFYFVFNTNQRSEMEPNSDPKDRKYVDPYHVFVIHAFEKGDKFGITDAINKWSSENKHEIAPVTWEQVGQQMIKWGGKSGAESWNIIKDKRKLFKYVPPNQEETDIAAVKGKTLNLEQFTRISRNAKVAYINMHNPITAEMMETLDVELKNLAINNLYKMPLRVLQNNLPLVKRYIKVQFGRGNPISGDYLAYMDDSMKQEYFDKYSMESYLSYDHIAKYFPAQLRSYIEDFINRMDYLPDYMEEYMTSDEREKFRKYKVAYSSCEFVAKEQSRDYIMVYHFLAHKLKKADFLRQNVLERREFVRTVKELISTNRLSEYPDIQDVLPPTRIIDHQLQIKFDGDKDYTTEQGMDILQESIYDDWGKYLLQRRSGLRK